MKSAWHDVQKEKPIESGLYVVVKFYGGFKPMVMLTTYSKKWGKFNVTDELKSDSLYIDVDFWARPDDIGLPTRRD